MARTQCDSFKEGKVCIQKEKYLQVFAFCLILRRFISLASQDTRTLTFYDRQDKHASDNTSTTDPHPPPPPRHPQPSSSLLTTLPTPVRTTLPSPPHAPFLHSAHCHSPKVQGREVRWGERMQGQRPRISDERI